MNKPQQSQSGEGSAGYSGKSLIVNSASNTVRLAIFLVIMFFLTPFIVRKLGNSLYGLWVVVMSFVGYAEMLELGLQRAMVKLVAENRAAGDTPKLNSQMSVAFYFFVFSGLLVIIAFSVVLPFFLDKLAKGVDFSNVPYILFPIIGIGVAIGFLNYVFTGILYGWQQYHRKNIVDVSTGLANALLVVVFLGKWGLVGLAVAQAVSNLLGLVATIVLVRTTVPELSFSHGAVTRASIRDLFSFGGKIFISSTMSRATTYAQPIIISSALTASATAFFSIPKRLLDTVRQLQWAMAAGFMPMFSDLERRGQSLLIRQVYVDYSRRILFFMLPIVVFVMLDGESFIGLWIGADYAQGGAAVLFFLSVAFLAELFQPLLWSLFIGLGQLNVLVTISTAMSALILLLTLVLIGPFGIAGAAMASAAATAIGQIFFTIALCRRLSISFWTLSMQIHLRPVMLAAGLWLMVWLGREIVGATSYARLVIGGLPGVSVYALLLFKFGLNTDDRVRIVRMVESLRDRLGLIRS